MNHIMKVKQQGKEGADNKITVFWILEREGKVSITIVKDEKTEP